MIEALAVLGGYLLGSLPFGYWVPLLVRNEDIRAKGSGNIGASNVFRVYGRSLGVPVALLDVAKGFAAAALGLWAGGALVGVLAAAAAMAGHARPVFLRFQKGGKMVATAGGGLFALAPLVFLCCAGVWIAVFVATRFASLASIVAALSEYLAETFVGLAGMALPASAAVLVGLQTFLRLEKMIEGHRTIANGYLELHRDGKAHFAKRLDGRMSIDELDVLFGEYRTRYHKLNRDSEAFSTSPQDLAEASAKP